MTSELNDKRKLLRHIDLIIVSVLSILIITMLTVPRDILVWGHSMVPVITDGTYINVTPYITYNKILGKQLDYNDIIVIKQKPNNVSSTNSYIFNQQSHTTEKETSIKRIVAKRGDKVRIEGGALYVNDERVEHNDVNGETRDEIICDGYYVLGDNAPLSVDSRHFGCITEDKILYVVTDQEKYKVKLGNFEAINKEVDSDAN